MFGWFVNKNMKHIKRTLMCIPFSLPTKNISTPFPNILKTNTHSKKRVPLTPMNQNPAENSN